MAKSDEYTTDIDELEELDDELGDELGDDLDDDLDDEVLEEDLHVDLTDGLDAGLNTGLGEELGGGAHDEDEEEDEVTELDEDEEEDEEEALDILLARDTGLDEELVRLDDESRDGLGNSDAPIGAGEFTCRSCFLVKRRPQLADEERMFCLDCV
ncbi:MAG: DUF4193 family protein [Egibacteraceae bacterium]